MQNNMLNIVSLNIESDRHFDRIIPFLNQQKAEVVLLQEVLEKDIAYLEEALGMKSVFAPILHWGSNELNYKLGMATFSNLPIVSQFVDYYRGHHDNLPLLTPGEAGKVPRAVLTTNISKGDELFCLANTHFTWTPDGKPNEYQYEDIENLLLCLQKIPNFILCGDFNAPRGTHIFNILASKYKDNIPAHITTTLDQNLHKAKGLQLVVDGLFTTPAYEVESIEVVDNVSDHCAIVAKVQKINN
jgi:endonuclease/exonuclease/phosphatase family metal-dependent hydrolase